ncbi:hypothetical protein CYY_006826 [Polysphondylium violaceum]|uniref:Uncharacterized protein n=1 Tax=Polysphondylium violaceum TaxID=133409 RepID=A0A8J4PQF6_9MYCE|nr:hypothetical protein CYY_006826 [Polysphondylium violaceum]
MIKYTLLLFVIISLATSSLAQSAQPIVYATDGQTVDTYQSIDDGNGPVIYFNSVSIENPPKAVFGIVDSNFEQKYIDVLVSRDNVTTVSLSRFILTGYSYDIDQFYLSPFTTSSIIPASFGYDASLGRVFYLTTTPTSIGWPAISLYGAYLGKSKYGTFLNKFSAKSEVALGTYDSSTRTYFAITNTNSTNTYGLQAISYNVVNNQRVVFNVSSSLLLDNNSQVIAVNGRFFIVQATGIIVSVFQADFNTKQVIFVTQSYMGWDPISSFKLTANGKYLSISATQQRYATTDVNMYNLDISPNPYGQFFLNQGTQINTTQSIFVEFP